MRTRAAVVAVVASLMVAACTGGEEPVVETATVRAGEVVQTVSAPARLEASARATVRAPLGGEIEELLVADGDVVAAGDPLVRLASDTVTSQIEQAETAVEAVEVAGAASEGAMLDLGPVLGAYRGQLDTLFPALLDTLGAQADTTEAALAAASSGIEETSRAASELTRGVQEALDEAQRALDELGGLDGVDEAKLPSLELSVEEFGDPGGGAVAGALSEAQRSARDTRRELVSTEQAFEDASRQLLDAEQELDAQAEATAAAQAAAIEAQIDQAELALEAARARSDDLLVVAPIGGVVELARGGGSGGGGLPGGIPAELGELTGDLGAADGLDGLGGPGDSGASGGPPVVGAPVGVGQELLSVFDLSGFTARVEVDEIDVVHLEVGQPVILNVDAFPGVELEGRVDHVALAPSSDVIGSALYPVTVALTQVPDDVELRVGLSASAEIEVRRLETDTVVPTSALLRRGEGEVLYVVREGRAVEVPVSLLAIGDEDAAIEGDVAPGEEVVTIGVELIEDGDEVGT